MERPAMPEAFPLPTLAKAFTLSEWVDEHACAESELRCTSQKRKAIQYLIHSIKELTLT